VVALGRQRRTFLRNAVAAAAQTEMQELAQQRPRRAPGCVVERRQIAAAAPSYVLKDAAGRRYMRLSEEGFFLWQQIDGMRTLRDLCVAYVERCRRPAPAEALRALARLHAEGFLALAAPRGTAPSHPRRDALRRLASLCTCYACLPDVDRRVTALYHALRFLYAPLAQAVLLVLAGAGAVAFGWLVLTGAPTPAGTLAHASSLWLASLVLHIVVHEAAHALTCKHFGRAVHRVGVGWYYFAPVAFVDTSDMWAAARWPRIAVSAAGPYANLVLAGVAVLAVLVPAAPAVREALWNFSLIGYALAAVNMNPLLELDGYYVLMDLCEIPDLRARALASVGACMGACLGGRAGAAPASGRALLLFGAASLAYGIAMGLALLLASRAWIGNMVAVWLPHPWAQALGWTLAAAMSLLVVYRLADGLRPRALRR
jgi:putative peptide zinc metalloprotease protein